VYWHTAVTRYCHACRDADTNPHSDTLHAACGSERTKRKQSDRP